jgi:hypothetical protein
VAVLTPFPLTTLNREDSIDPEPFPDFAALIADIFMNVLLNIIRLGDAQGLLASYTRFLVAVHENSESRFLNQRSKATWIKTKARSLAVHCLQNHGEK